MASRRLRLIQHRKALGLTQEQLAEHAGVDRSTTGRWERGDSEPQPWQRPRLAHTLQVSVEQLDDLLALIEVEDAGNADSLNPHGDERPDRRRQQLFDPRPGADEDCRAQLGAAIKRDRQAADDTQREPHPNPENEHRASLSSARTASGRRAEAKITNGDVEPIPAFTLSLGGGSPERRVGDPPRITFSMSTLHAIALGFGTALPPPIAETVSGLRRRLDETLSSAAIRDSVADHWRSVADGYGRIYRASPPLAFLANIVRDIAELHSVTEQRLSTAQRRGLCGAMAQMAGLLATTLINLNDCNEARSWLQTAERAAEESEDVALRAWVMVRHAVSALYWNDPYRALELAGRAASLTHGMRCVAAVWAPAVQARACSRLGPDYVEATRVAIGQAETAYSTFEAQPREQDAYGYTAAQLHFYRSNALTQMGDTSAAYQAQVAALDHYGDNSFLDPSLVRLDRASCLLRDGEAEKAADLAKRTLTSLPQEHLSPIVVQRTHQFATAIPADDRRLGPIRELYDALAARDSRTIEASPI